MLFSNQISASAPLDFHLLHQVIASGITSVEIQLPEERYSTAELTALTSISKLSILAYRMPRKMGLGTAAFQIDDWKYWFETIRQASDLQKLYVIVHGMAVPLGAVFEYLDTKPTDFNALQDFKTLYVKRMITQIKQISNLAKTYELEVLVENAPMGGEAYFEPGKSLIHPALRTPRHLLHIVEATGVKICLDTANGRITSHALTYMHRSRSLFAGATEKEILFSTKNWIDFYTQLKPYISLVRLSYAISWGDTKETSHIPFTPDTYVELLSFAEQVNPQTPIILATGQSKEQLSQTMQTLHDLKKI